MRTSLLRWSLALLATLASFDAAQAVTNLVSNGGFEEVEGAMPRGWSVPPHMTDRGTATADTANVHGGRRSLKMVPTKRNQAEGFAVYAPLSPQALQGKQVTISGFVAVDGVGQNPVALLFKAGGENWILVSKDTAGKFVPFSRAFSVPKDATEAALLLFVGGTQGRAWFDDLSVVAGATNAASTGSGPSPPSKMLVRSEAANRINTDGWTDSAFISPDEKELYFAYMPYAQNAYMDIFFGRVRKEDVKLRGPDRPGNHGDMNFETYVSARNPDGTWGPPRNININSNYHLASAKLSLNGKELYYSIRHFSQNYGGEDIYYSRRNQDGTWTPPQNLGPDINTRDREDTPCLSPDGQTLYFNRNQGETLGWEIYFSRKVNGRWSPAEKMPPPINQKSPETTANHQPFITADGKEFYFTRIMNLHRSRLKADGTWGTPEPVLRLIPVSGHASVSADNQRLYFLTAADKTALERHCWTIWVADRQKDGTWGNARPVD